MSQRPIAVVLALALSAGLFAQSRDAADEMLRSALQKEQVDHDLRTAVDQYNAIIQRFPGHAAAARAMLQLGGIYEQVLNPEAAQLYQLLLKDPGVDRSVAAEAKRRLAAWSVRAVPPFQSQLPIPVEVLGSFGGRVSPDGRAISFLSDSLKLNGDGNLGFWDLRSGQSRLLTRSKGWEEGYGRESVWSPDGRSLAYCWFNAVDRRYELRTVEVSGGPPRTVFRAEGGRLLSVFSWSPDGKHIAAAVQTLAASPNNYQIALIATEDGSVRVLKAFESVRRPDRAAFSPDGKYLAYDFAPVEASPSRDIFVLSLERDELTDLVVDPGSSDELLGWFPDGDHLLYVCHWRGTREVRAIRVNQGRPVLDGFAVRRDVGDVTGLGFSKDGRFFVLKGSGKSDVLVVPMNPTSTTVAGPVSSLPPASPVGRAQASWSPDGKQIAYFEQITGTDWTLTVLTLDSGARRMYPTSTREPERPAWQPDGRAIVFHAFGRDNQGTLWRVNLETGSVDRFSSGHTGAFSPDGLFFFHPGRGGGGAPGTILRMRLSDSQEEIVDRGPRRALALSPDGRYLAVFDPGSRPTRPPSISITPASGGDRRTIVADFMNDVLDNEIAWSHDSRFVLFIANDVWRVPISGGSPEPLGIFVGAAKQMSMSPDGRRLALSVYGQQMEVWVWENLLPKRKQP